LKNFHEFRRQNISADIVRYKAPHSGYQADHSQPQPKSLVPGEAPSFKPGRTT
jgi:hypothetical protein